VRRALIIGGLKAAGRKPPSIQTRALRAGDVVFREGDDPRGEAFLVHAGRVEVRKKVGDEERLLWTYGKGELLGELGLFAGGAPRSATAVAVEAVTLLVIPAKNLTSLVRANPTLAVAIIKDLSAKLLATNQLLVAEGERRQPTARVTS
jgi:CRP/FNR family transcriptional regulator, cyclic AMP receptor protein